MYYWLTVFSPLAVNFSLGSLSTNWKYPHSQSASWNDFRGPSVQALPHPLRVSFARARSLFRPLLPSACYAGYWNTGLYTLVSLVLYMNSCTTCGSTILLLYVLVKTWNATNVYEIHQLRGSCFTWFHFHSSHTWFISFIYICHISSLSWEHMNT